ncbi:MAG TPA: tetratricopeptide repeat protein [Terriglobales bacterium]|nr:tetratricopeptide repeat protein [Terriglobales bacterium]
MPQVTLKPITSRPPAVIASLAVLAIFGFIGVTKLVNRFGEQQKALARHLYQRALEDQKDGKPDLAVEHFRDALVYSPDNFEYRLQLARALRDTGRTEEAEAYLVSLWERAPQDGAVNLALGRLAARQNSIDKALQYYHNAIYGVWSSDADDRRLQAWFELIEFLLKENARPQAEAELITLSAELPPRTDLRLRVADLFATTQLYERALAEYSQVLKVDDRNERALAGAGEAEFKLGHFRDAERYLGELSAANSQDSQVARMLEVSREVLARDPFRGYISIEERNQRLRGIFEDAGKRLESCMASENGKPQAAGLSALETQWNDMKRELVRLRSSREAGLPNRVMDLVLKIEQQTQICPPSATDEALMLLAQNRGSEL